MSIRVAIFGSAGQLGTELVREFRKRGAEVLPFRRTEVDITNAGQVDDALPEGSADVVVNAAAYNMVDVAEKEPMAAYSVNALSVRNLAMACRRTGARFVQFSTDYVFDGSAGRPYTEQDNTRPLSAYAVSKLAGELYAQAYLEEPLILRTSGVFGPAGIRTARGNFLELMLRLAAARQPIRVVEDHVASPTYAPELARCTAELVERNVRGLFHAGGGEPISWYDFARLIFQEAGLSPELLPTNEHEYRTAARRPKFSALSNGKLNTVILSPMPPLADAVRDYFVRRGSDHNSVEAEHAL